MIDLHCLLSSPSCITIGADSDTSSFADVFQCWCLVSPLPRLNIAERFHRYCLRQTAFAWNRRQVSFSPRLLLHRLILVTLRSYAARSLVSAAMRLHGPPICCDNVMTDSIGADTIDALGYVYKFYRARADCSY